MILSFELSMPNVGSWNGQWTGQDRRYYTHRHVTKKQGEQILAGKEWASWYYDFGDGWGASVSVVQVTASEKKKRDKVSAGFCGYDWMIDEIFQYGRILTLKERHELTQPVRELN